MDSSTSPPAVSRYWILLAFASIYLFWGGTYTAARIGVHWMPATVLAGVRLSIAGCILLAICALRGKRMIAPAAEMRRIALLGVLLLFTGNVGLVWAEYYLPSGLAALFVAIVPVYVALIERFLPDGERLRTRGYIGLGLGFFGLAILAWPSARSGLRGDEHQILAICVLLLGSLSFSSGSVLARHSKFTLSPFVCAGWEMVIAGVCDLGLATALHQWPRVHWTHDDSLVIAYLILFGSLVGFSSYVWLLSHVPVAKVATYAYVNPVVAVLLGALILGEHMPRNESVGMVVILVAVFLVTSSKVQNSQLEAEMERMPLEAEM